MSEPKFTPGPWNADGVYVCDKNDAEVALCDGDNWEPNSYLIAAAPELYEALKDMHRTQLNNNRHDPDDYENTEQFLRVTAALAKARGEQ